jgi:ankyrin repeat protein
MHAGADVESRDHLGRTALHFAVDCNNPVVVELLLEHGADAETADFQGRTPLLVALAAGRKLGTLAGAEQGSAARVRQVG